jgi:hypothetical protein
MTQPIQKRLSIKRLRQDCVRRIEPEAPRQILPVFRRKERTRLQYQNFAATTSDLVRAVAAVHAGAYDDGIKHRDSILQMADLHGPSGLIPCVAKERPMLSRVNFVRCTPTRGASK